MENSELKTDNTDLILPYYNRVSKKTSFLIYNEERKRNLWRRNSFKNDFCSYLSHLLANTIKTNQVEINTDTRSQKAVARLKEPRDLFTLPKEPECAQEAARWPAECQVVDMKSHLMDMMPSQPEPYYTVTGRELTVRQVGENPGQVVYQYNPMSAVNYFTRSISGGNRVKAQELTNRDLRFESRFESGNLEKAVKITDTYYELSLRSDLYTNKHMQWFYFLIENTKKDTVYRFSIVNLLKGDSLYNEGMRPVMYSLKEAVINKVGWKRCGSNINYYQNDQGSEDDQNSTFTLTFTLVFPHDDDCVYLAHSYPYTYTDLQEYLIKLQNHPVKSVFTKLRLLCKTLAGNNVYYLTVTDPISEVEQFSKPKKKAIVITARVHPGEAPSSWMMKGVIDFITSDSLQAKELREKFIFKLIPMLNPDGVIVGNNRCSLSGRDLNRQYRTVIRETYPPVWHTKVMIKRLIDECGVAMYCDFHAHSRKHNVFIYGCENRRATDKRLQEQVFPLMLHKNSADKFSFENCKFRVHKDKEGTGRVVIWMMGVDNSYTLETSFAGSTMGSRVYTHFSTLDYENMGKSFCETLLDFVDDTPCKLRLRSKIILKLQKEGSNADEPANIDLSDYSSDEGELSELSDEEKRKREDHVLTAPPPSPILLHERKSSHKDGTPKSHKRPTPVVAYTPPVQRKILQIPKAILDLENEGFSSGDEFIQKSLQRNRTDFPKSADGYYYSRGDKMSMPPELIVTSTVQGPEISRITKGSKAQKGGRLNVNKSVSRRSSCQKLSPLRTVSNRQSGDMSDPECRAPTEINIPFKQQFWRVLSSDNLPWSYSTSMSNDQVLKACSAKLAELKRRHKSKKDKVEQDLAGLPLRQPIKKKQKQRRTKSMRYERSGSYGLNDTELLKIRPFKSQDQKKVVLETQNKNAKKAPNNKFRKGGLVSLATVNSGAARVDPASGDDSAGNNGTKKKKKKRKIIQLQKHMKSAVTAVAAVAMTKKDAASKTSSKKRV